MSAQVHKGETTPAYGSLTGSSSNSMCGHWCESHEKATRERCPSDKFRIGITCGRSAQQGSH